MTPEQRDQIEKGLNPIAKRGGYQPSAIGPPPTVPPPQRSDSVASAVPPRFRAGEGTT